MYDSVVTWETSDPEDSDGYTAPSSRGETKDSEDSDGFTYEFNFAFDQFSRNVLFVGGFSGNRHGSSPWKTRRSPCTKILKMAGFLNRAMFDTFNVGFIFSPA